MVILVTGCAGFIGSNIVERLLQIGDTVIGLDNLEYGHYKNIAEFESNKNFTFYKEDIRNRDAVDRIIKDEHITHICHQAARGSVSKSIDDPLLTNDINVTGTLNMLWLAHTNGIEKIVCAISSSVYGDTPVMPKVETMAYNPISPYALTKVTNEMYCKVFYEVYGLRTIGLRYFNVYGKKQDPDGPYAAIIPRWINKAIDNKDLELNGTGTQTRDFTYIDDVVDANILALTCTNTDAFGKGMNICFGEQTSIADLGRVIIDSVGSVAKLVPSPARKGDIQDSLGDFSRAKTLIGYNPKTSIQEGIKKALTWYSDNHSYFS
ncbi:GDP-mannose 4,6-dehydratase [Candidatus Gracilibacteria bacterium]|nr:GDP-mannose 4,6-dehydratase [Candidatus Gracilibacteria bacterium]